jgi:hypothetical protein
MNPKRYKRDLYSNALVIADVQEIVMFSEKQKMERTIDELKDEIHNMKLQLQEILNNTQSRKRSNKCQ